MQINLNKANTWDAFDMQYPTAMCKFRKFIDIYKAENGWNDLFNSNSDYQNRLGKNAVAPKFHDLPFEMQIGIIIAFLRIYNCANDTFLITAVKTYNDFRKWVDDKFSFVEAKVSVC